MLAFEISAKGEWDETRLLPYSAILPYHTLNYTR